MSLCMHPMLMSNLYLFSKCANLEYTNEIQRIYGHLVILPIQAMGICFLGSLPTLFGKWSSYSAFAA